ncbi:hypothetical protein [Salinivibrio sp. YCSC6]|uniref:hypothetical protein n=1 Tax=Salinivibrio sp. YCSC6 TaxID=2003370 RepID=UPI000BBC12BB|nr:hypothetical protein [Salinivibrio sp. YCSC6]PCE65285.1 hypothetical protein B6G00_14975 [Salinivibrio sp. YCSC6]QCF37675.1 hypothetical protein E8E00_15885 [Salinivibrio sp. YCSC6]
MTMTYATQKLKEACEADINILNKLTEVKDRAPNYDTPGPRNLDQHAKHAHITNNTGIAWVYTNDGNDQHILALGRKSDGAGSGNSGYIWDKNGNP